MAEYAYKEGSTNKGMSPLTIAMLGAIAGAVGTGVAMALSNPQNRKKVQQTMHDSQQWMSKTINDVKQSASDMEHSLVGGAGKAGKNAEHIVTEAKEATDQRRASVK